MLPSLCYSHPHLNSHAVPHFTFFGPCICTPCIQCTCVFTCVGGVYVHVYICGRERATFPGFPCLCLLSSWVTDRPQCLFNVCVGSGEPYFGSLACTRSTLFIDTTPRSLYCIFKAESQEQPTQSDLQSEKCLISLEVETSGSCQIYKGFQEVLRESLKK